LRRGGIGQRRAPTSTKPLTLQIVVDDYFGK
jgi:hypothetical protein